jgi:hypothetical protein
LPDRERNENGVQGTLESWPGRRSINLRCVKPEP